MTGKSRLLAGGAVSFVLAAVAMVAALPSSAGGHAVRDTSTLIISRTVDPAGLDPAEIVSTGAGGGVETFIASYERLFDLTPSGKIVPKLATSWSVSKNGLVYTIHLRKGVKFHDGSLLTSSEVRFTWQRIVGINGPAAQYWRPVKDVVAASPYVVKIVLKKVDPTLILTLAGERGSYIGPDEACVKAHESKPGDWAVDWMATHECGTGPYTLTNWQHGQELDFQAFQDYWGGWKGRHVTRIVEKIVPAAGTQRLLLQQGQLDFLGDPPATDVAKALSKDPNIKVVTSPTTTIDQFTFNMDKKPTSNPLVRKAIALAFNYNKAIAQAYRGWAKRVYGPIPSNIWPAIPKSWASGYRYDPAKAKQLLAEAGYKDGLTLNLSGMDTGTWKPLILSLQSDLAKVGVKLNVHFMTWPVLFAQLQKPKGQKPFDMAAYQMWAAIPDPSDILMWWHTRAITVINPGWGTRTTDKWLDTSLSTLSKSKRATLYSNVIKQMEKDVPGIWIDQPENIAVMRKSVGGYQYVPYYNGIIDPYQLYKTS
ncbi:MAG: ABC transporter substrate-binding protein [Mycolicibacterium hassiacum]|uniref:ABC transporter substrate-binding protein n=1 Tax=Mycolicibacterium hassiacum TaxID=46351 RepID=UPI0023F78234|nr:ABC transporter substrate-binding protein [Mycolicibacterium hassiacum]MBX5485444.1 ABC transporter substrate-binding protein [Mycolicibacterium hassiacum]